MNLIEQTQQAVERLRGLLADAHPGLATWNIALLNAYKELGKLFQTEPVKVLWDVDDGAIVIGENFEAHTSSGCTATQLVEYLRSKGVVVAYTDHDQGTTETR